MRPESVKKIRIRTSTSRNGTGSVSPPIPGEGKALFAEKMRKMFGNLNPEQLEIKIEQLWNGLTQENRDKLIKKRGEKENITETKTPSPPPPPVVKKPCVPILERRNNCKAIAKVLDLKTTTKPSTIPYSELVKNRMKAYWKEKSMITPRNLGFSPPKTQKTEEPAEIPCLNAESPDIPSQIEPDFDMDPVNDRISDFEDLLEEMPSITPIKVPEIKKSIESAPPPPKSIIKRIIKRKIVKTVRFVRKGAEPISVPPPAQKISYNEASEKYYHALSHCFLIGDNSIDKEMLQQYANIMEGCRPIREYQFGINL